MAGTSRALAVAAAMAPILLEVQFNHDAVDKRHSGLNLRVDFDTPLPRPEWRRQPATGLVTAFPAAYALAIVEPAGIMVQARIGWRDGAPPPGIEVRAVVEEGPPAPSGDPALLGGPARRACAFGPDGTTGLAAFRLSGARLGVAPVGVHDIAWRWQFRAAAGLPWVEFDRSRHRIFTTLFPPTPPWGQVPERDDNVALPWTEVLEFACRWAAGTRTRAAAAAAVTAAVFGLGNGLLSYGCPILAREMYSNTPLNIFDCTAFVERLHGGIGNGGWVNCTDCACIVSTFANALGADLWQARMGAYTPPFMTRDILAIGSRTWQTPCGLGLGFAYHEVAWSGDCTEDDAVYDACLLVDADIYGLLFQRVPLLPADLIFGAPWLGWYRSLIARGDSQLLCRPRPEERRRRALV